MPAVVYETLRVVAVVAGALVAWFAAGPIASGLTRLAFQRSLPQAGQVVARVGGSLLAGVLIYVFFTLGPGWGPGGGGAGTNGGTGDDKGPGIAGTDKVKDKVIKDKPVTEKPITDKNGKPAHTDWLFIEVIGGERYPGGGKYYLLQRKDPPVSRDDVEALLKEKKQAFREIHIVLTGDSNGGAETRLRKKLDELLTDRSYAFVVRTQDERKKVSGE